MSILLYWMCLYVTPCRYGNERAEPAETAFVTCVIAKKKLQATDRITFLTRWYRGNVRRVWHRLLGLSDRSRTFLADVCIRSRKRRLSTVR